MLLRSFLGSVMVVSACAAPPSVDVVETVGDTTHVTSLSEPRWGSELNAVVDLEIGSPDGADEYIFGRLEPMDVTVDGGVVVYDQMYNRISHFRPDGTFAGSVGAAGQGPGEYDAVVALAASLSGSLVAQLYDGRILSYSEDGEYMAEWRSDRQLALDRGLTEVPGSLLMLKTIVPNAERGSPLRYRFLRLTWSGTVVDSFPDLPTPWDDGVGRGQADITPSRISRWSPADFGVTVVGSRLAFQKVSPSGEVLRVERAFEPVSFLPDERADWEAQNEFLRRRAGDDARFPRVPDYKPVVRDVFTPPSGEIWLQVSTRSIGPDPGHVTVVAGLRATPEWLEPLRLEVFAASGVYLGTVVGPAGIDVRVVSDGRIWGYRNGALGEQRIVRLQVGGLQ